MPRIPFNRHRFPPQLILYPVRRYCRLALPYRVVRDLPASVVSKLMHLRSTTGFVRLALK